MPAKNTDIGILQYFIQTLASKTDGFLGKFQTAFDLYCNIYPDNQNLDNLFL